jgi:plastocyanin
MKQILILLVVALLLATCGCTQSAADVAPTPVPATDTVSPTYPPTTAMPTREPTASVSDNTITIRKEGFTPSTITVKRGSTVRWVNMDSTEDPALYNPTHRIKIIGVYTGQTLSPGEGWSWVFTNTGVYAYEDLIHPDLQGTVIVE